jgi:hypothetical protein
MDVAGNIVKAATGCVGVEVDGSTSSGSDPAKRRPACGHLDCSAAPEAWSRRRPAGRWMDERGGCEWRLRYRGDWRPNQERPGRRWQFFWPGIAVAVPVTRGPAAGGGMYARGEAAPGRQDTISVKCLRNLRVSLCFFTCLWLGFYPAVGSFFSSQNTSAKNIEEQERL